MERLYRHDLRSLCAVDAAVGDRGQAVVLDVAVVVPAATVDTVGVRGDVVVRCSTGALVARSGNINDRKGTEVL